MQNLAQTNEPPAVEQAISESNEDADSKRLISQYPVQNNPTTTEHRQGSGRRQDDDQAQDSPATHYINRANRGDGTLDSNMPIIDENEERTAPDLTNFEQIDQKQQTSVSTPRSEKQRPTQHSQNRQKSVGAASPSRTLQIKIQDIFEEEKI